MIKTDPLSSNGDTSASERGGPDRPLFRTAYSLQWTRRDTFLIIAVTIIGALLRFIRLDKPGTIIFDETYYAKDACLYLGLGQSFCNAPLATEQSWVHPPLGKWIIAAGIKIFGFHPFGWRVSSAIFGTAMVVVIYLLARTLFRNRSVAALAGTLAATDFMLIVQSRIAMLDVFLAFFIVLGFLFLAFDRNSLLVQREQLQLPFPDKLPARNIEWRFAAGAAFGLAISIKWSAIWGLAAAGMLAIAWSYGVARQRARTEGTAKGANGWFLNELLMSFLALAIVPLAAYAASYTLWFFENGFDVKEFFGLQDRILRFHLDLKATHGYQSKAWTWPLVIRPVAYFYEGEPKSVHVLSFGNPVVWWAAIPALAYLALRSIRSWRAERVVITVWLVQYLPWIFIARALFIFYMTPIVPFMMIGLARGLGRVREFGRFGRLAVVVYLLLGVGIALVWWYPVIGAVALPYKSWLARMFLQKSWI